MNIEDFKEAIELIGWKFRFCGCDTYVLVNDIGKATEIEVTNEKIQIKTRKCFGDTKSKKYPQYVSFGGIYFYFKDCELYIQKDFVSLRGKENNSCFISFRKINKRC